MGDRKTPLVPGEFYHIYNRGVAKQPTFFNKKDYEQALLSLFYYRFENIPMKLSRFKGLSKDEREKLIAKLEKTNQVLVQIVSFVLMPNHFHLLLKQETKEGIAVFISKFTNSYTKYFNIKRERIGPLFQGIFKSVLIEDDEQLLHLSRYIHINPVVSSIIKESDLLSYKWSSLPAYLEGSSSLIWKDPILNFFPTSDGYKQFVFDQVDYGKQLEVIKHLICEER